jgi:hypothetical protein
MILRTWRGSTRAEDAEPAAFQATAGNRGAVVFEDDRYLVGRDLHVDHFDVVYAAGELAGAGAA